MTSRVFFNPSLIFSINRFMKAVRKNSSKKTKSFVDSFTSAWLTTANSDQEPEIWLKPAVRTIWTRGLSVGLISLYTPSAKLRQMCVFRGHCKNLMFPADEGERVRGKGWARLSCSVDSSLLLFTQSLSSAFCLFNSPHLTLRALHCDRRYLLWTGHKQIY